MTYPYILQGDNIILNVDSKVHTINPSHLNYKKILKAIKKQKWEKIPKLLEVVESIKSYANGAVTIEGNSLYFNGEQLNSYLSNKIIKMYKEGFDIDPLTAFLQNLNMNPSSTAVSELYQFLEKGNLPITPDGHFLAYKKVQNDYKDCYTGTIDNSVGQIVEMPRNQVDDNRFNHCSSGLHFCSLDYLNHFSGSRIVVVKIHPKDVVSIPDDYDFTKGRCCRYEVVGEIECRPEDALKKSVMSYSDGEEDDEGYINDTEDEEYDEDFDNDHDEIDRGVGIKILLIKE